MNLDRNRVRTHKVIDMYDPIGMGGVYSGSYENCLEFMSEQSDTFGMSIIANPYYRR